MSNKRDDNTFAEKKEEEGPSSHANDPALVLVGGLSSPEGEFPTTTEEEGVVVSTTEDVDGEDAGETPFLEGGESGRGADDEDDEEDEDAVPLTVRSADEQYSIGIDLIRRHMYQPALKHFGRAIFLAPGEPLPYVARAEAYTHLNDLRSSVANYRRALTFMRDPVAMEDLQGRLAQVLDTYALITLRSNKPTEALRFIEESLAEKPEQRVVILHKCLCLVTLGEDAEAQRLLSSIVRDPEVEADASVMLVQLLTKVEDFAGAKKLLEVILYKYPDHPRILDMERYFDRVFHEYRTNAQDTLNVDALTRCVAAFGEDAELYRMRAIAHASRKSYTLAVQDLFSCINKSGGSNPTASELMGSLLCTIADELAVSEDYVAAITYYTEAVKWTEDDFDVFIARADCLQRIGKHETALADYKLVLDRDPANLMAKQRLGQLHDTWGSILYNQGNWELSEAEFTRAIGYIDTLPAFHYHRALCRLMLKEQTMAVRDLISCRDLGAMDPDIVRLVNQFCLPKGPHAPQQTPSNTNGGNSGRRLQPLNQSNRQGTNSAMRKSLPTDLMRDAEVHLTNREYAQLKRDGANGADLCRLRIQKDTGNTMMKGKYNPTAIRDYVKHSAIATRTAVVVDTDARGSRAVQEMESRHVARKVPTFIGGPLWSGTKVTTPSRLDLVHVSAAQPVPAKYATAQHKRRDAERAMDMQYATVPALDPRNLIPVQQTINRKRQGARLASFKTVHAEDPNASTFTVARKGIAQRPVPVVTRLPPTTTTTTTAVAPPTTVDPSVEEGHAPVHEE